MAPAPDSVFAFRERFIDLFATVFTAESWQGTHNAREAFWTFSKALENHDVGVTLSAGDIQNLTRNPALNIAAVLSTHAINDTLDRILPSAKHGRGTTRVVLASYPLLEDIPALQSAQDSFLRSISNRMLYWAQAQDIGACIASFAKPWETEKQTTHLAALAYVGDFQTLMDYQAMFKRGQRANFHLMITPDMIDRAVDIAIERA